MRGIKKRSLRILLILLILLVTSIFYFEDENDRELTYEEYDLVLDEICRVMRYEVRKSVKVFNKMVGIKRRSLRIFNRLNNISSGTGTEVIENGCELTYEEYDTVFDEICGTIIQLKHLPQFNNNLNLIKSSGFHESNSNIMIAKLANKLNLLKSIDFHGSVINVVFKNDKLYFEKNITNKI